MPFAENFNVSFHGVTHLSFFICHHHKFLWHSLTHHRNSQQTLLSYASLEPGLPGIITIIVLCQQSRAAPKEQRYCRAKMLSSLTLLTRLLCFTYPLPDHKKSLGFQNLPQISPGFPSVLLILEFFTKALLKIIICNSTFHEDVSKNPVPLCYCLYPEIPYLYF